MTETQSAGPDDDPSSSASIKLRTALVQILFQRTATALAISVTTLLLGYALLSGSVAPAHLNIWLCAGLLVSAARAILIYLTARGKPNAYPLKAHTILVALMGSVWGAMAFFWSPELGLAEQLVVITYPMVLSVGVVSAYGAWLPTFFAFTIPAQTPLILILLTSGNLSLAKLTLPAMLFMLAQGVLVKRYNAQLRETVRLQLANEELVTDLSAQNAQLAEARDDAFAANRAKSEFLARMSHEIRTPMNGVLGMAQMLLKSDLPSQQRDTADTLYSSGKHLLRLINELLDVSRIEAGQLEIENQDFELRSLVGLVALSQQVVAEDKNLQFNCAVDDAVPAWVKGDPLRLQQILLNLTSNAIKFTEQGRVDVNISIARAADAAHDANKLLITVSDTGIGIATDRLDAIFDVFQQADGSITRRFGGSGLGLSIARELAELMDGSVEVSSTIGVGTTFVVTLPLMAAEAQSAADGEMRIDEANSISSTASVLGASPIRVVVAEDNEVNQMVVAAMLEDIASVVTMVANGQALLDELQRADYDIVLMDCQMPVMDGLTATVEARRQGHRLPIIAVTANAMAGDRERCLEAGMNDYISKPLDSDLLEEMLRRWTNLPPQSSDVAVAA